MKYLFAFKKGDKYLVKISLDNGKEVWANTTDAVLSFAKKNFEENEEVDIGYTEKNGRYTIQKIIKKGANPDSSSKSDTNNTEFACEECGAKLKDNKYKKCYTCNQKKSNGNTCEECGVVLKDDKYKKCYKCNQKDGKPYHKSHSTNKDDTNTSIMKMSIMRGACQAVTTLAGHVDDPSTLGDIIIELYDKLYAKVTS